MDRREQEFQRRVEVMTQAELDRRFPNMSQSERMEAYQGAKLTALGQMLGLTLDEEEAYYLETVDDGGISDHALWRRLHPPEDRSN